jgi:hypothetical protein
MILDIFEGLDVLKVLGYGLSGFAFLLMMFAFLLLRQIISKDKESNRMIFKSIWAFMGLSFLMTIAIGMFSFFVSDYKQTEVKDLGAAVRTYADAKQLNTQSEKADSSNLFSNPDSLKSFKHEQDKVISSLDSTIKESDAPPVVKQDFDNLKAKREMVYRSLDTASTPERKDILSKELSKVNKQLTNLSVEAVKTRPSVVKYMH